MDFTEVCRTCLGNSNLSSIFEFFKEDNDYTADIYHITGVQITPNDGLPQKMCSKCLNHLDKCLKFRNKCRNAEIELLKIKCELDNKPEEIRRDKHKKIIDSDTIRVFHKIEETNENIQGIFFKAELAESAKKQDDIEDISISVEYLDDIDSDNDLLQTDVEVLNTNSVKNEIGNDDIYSLDCDFEKSKTAPKLNPRRVTCKLCHKNLSVRSLDYHMSQRHPGADERKVKCELCDSYILKDKMMRHNMLMHGTGQTCRCGYCKMEFDSKETLIEHVASCTAKKKKRKVCESGRALSECNICNKTMQKSSLRMHIRVKHAGLGPICEHCGTRFGNKLRLSEHCRAKHGYAKFKCSQCDFQSARKLAMMDHERRHRGEKPFACELCDAKFHAAYLLTQHKQSHRTEKLLKCNMCPASFKANNSLHLHKMQCHSTSLYKCAMCARVYSCRHYAVKHIRVVHRYWGLVPPLQKVAGKIIDFETVDDDVVE